MPETFITLVLSPLDKQTSIPSLHSIRGLPSASTVKSMLPSRMCHVAAGDVLNMPEANNASACVKYASASFLNLGFDLKWSI